MSGYGYHWSKCPGGSGGSGAGGGVVVLVCLLVVLSVCRHTVEHVLGALVELTLVVMGGTLAITGTVVLVLVLRASRSRRAAIGERRPAALPADVIGAEVVSRQDAPAIEAPRPGVHALPRSDVSAHSRISAHPHVVTSRTTRPRCTHRPGGRS